MAGRGEAVEVDQRNAVEHGVTDLHHAAESGQSLLIDLFVGEQFRVIEEIPQELTVHDQSPLRSNYRTSEPGRFHSKNPGVRVSLRSRHSSTSCTASLSRTGTDRSARL
jgi:hypothetical protein